jgi:6,7-dimethyl-8-ribityllumazine synthase
MTGSNSMTGSRGGDGVRDAVVREGVINGKGLRVALVVARFNAHITELLLEGALDGCLSHGVAPGDLEVIRVPGAFELPGTVARILARGRVDAVVALGCVIRGETAHFDFVAGEAARGLADLSRTATVPVIFGVLTTETEEQAYVRAGVAIRAADGAPQHSNTGWTSACAALEMATLYRELR